jgi:peptidyl-dipeptidase Dcp
VSKGLENPLLKAWTTPFETPPFDEIKPEHFMPAFEQAFFDHSAEIAAIVNDPTVPDFANTITALERSGKLLSRVASVFYDLVSAHSNPAILEIDKDVSSRMARHWNPIMMNAVLFGRIVALHDRRAELGLTTEQMRLLERTYTRFHRSGAGLDEAAKARMAEINERLAHLGTSFSHHLLGDEQEWFMELGEGDLDGLAESFVASAKASADERGMTGKAIITTSRSSMEPFLKSSARRDLRERAYKAFTQRGNNGNANDNNETIVEILKLREETAKLLGFPTFAAYRLEDSMAKTPEAVRSLLERVWKPARARALADRDALQELIAEEGGNFKLAAWDWRYYSEKLRKVRCDIDETAIKPYFQLDRIIEAAFYTANRLFGLTFERREGIPVWHDDVRVWEVRDAAGRHRGLFFGDYFARGSKHSGAWMTTLRDQEKLRGDIRPLVVNVMNFSKASAGEPTLLSFDDARTLFHEFGHALHALLSDVTYPMISGTSVLTDWVELPSQLYEHWLERPEVLSRFAVHFRTGEPIPQDLLRRLIAARTFNQGWATVEYVASALVDLDVHLQAAQSDAKVGDTKAAGAKPFDISAFEHDALARIGMPAEIVMRHRPTHFQHVFAGSGYAAAYYSYMWSEVLDADAFAAFEEAGDIFDAGTAKNLRDHVYAAGGSRDPVELYTAFRGRMPTPDGLLRRRGLSEKVAETST